MAFSQSLQKGQIPVCCKLCEADTKISWKCIDCDLLMCDKCKVRIHPNIRNAIKHKIVDIKQVGPHTEELDFSNIKCKEHGSQGCVMFCKSCDKLVCPLCIAQVHNGHGLVEIREGYQIQVQRIQEGQNNLKINTNRLSKKESKAQEMKETERLKYQYYKKEIQAQNIFLKKAVDQYTEKLLKELDEKWEILKNSIEKQEKRVMALKKATTDKENHVENILNANDVEQVFEESKEVETWLRDVEDHLELNFRTMPIFLPGQVDETNVGSLQETTTQVEMKVVKEFTTDISQVFFMSSCLESLWITNQNELQKVQPEVNKLKMMRRFDIAVYGMAVTPSNDLLLPSGGTSLKKISFCKGLLTDTIYTIDPLLIISLHVTRDYQVIVGGRSPGEAFPATGRRVVILMDKNGKHKTVYEHDRNNQPIFTYPRRITSTNSGNICVVDRLSADYRGRVVVLAQEGNILNIYNGHLATNTEGKPFQPEYIEATPSDTIIVIGKNTNVLHILDSLGQLITHVNTNDIGILNPYSVTFTASGKSYIGCIQQKSSSGKANLYEVSISGF